MNWWQFILFVWGSIIVLAGAFVATVSALIALKERHDEARRDR